MVGMSEVISIVSGTVNRAKGKNQNSCATLAEETLISQQYVNGTYCVPAGGTANSATNWLWRATPDFAMRDFSWLRAV